MFKHILIPTDGSSFSEKVVNDGIALAKTLGAKVTGVHVLPTLFMPVTEVGMFDADLIQRAEEAARREGQIYLARIKNAAEAAGVHCEGVLVDHEQPWKGIIDVAAKQRCDLIMMAAHGRRGVAALVIGSEANKVLTHSKIPVLIYR